MPLSTRRSEPSQQAISEHVIIDSPCPVFLRRGRHYWLSQLCSSSADVRLSTEQWSRFVLFCLLAGSSVSFFPPPPSPQDLDFCYRSSLLTITQN